MKLILPLSLALILHLTSCNLFKKSDPKPLTELEKLPPATQSGKYTFGCLINGKAFVPKSTTDFTAIYQQGILDFRSLAYNPDKTIKFVLLEQDFGLLNVGSYSLTKYQTSFVSVSAQLIDKSECDYQGENTISGQISITKLDRVNYIMPGTFQFTSKAPGCDTLKVTDGRFDIKYIP
ncbi:MAG: hypothetical protein JST69_14225 [Bacteroidetes bacterium]|nr:hypothetical protein [Bacteroidota bacterium]